jgi:hypothetical protein
MTKKALKWMMAKCLFKADEATCMIERGYFMDEYRKFSQALVNANR